MKFFNVNDFIDLEKRLSIENNGNGVITTTLGRVVAIAPYIAMKSEPKENMKLNRLYLAMISAMSNQL